METTPIETVEPVNGRSLAGQPRHEHHNSGLEDIDINMIRVRTLAKAVKYHAKHFAWAMQTGGDMAEIQADARQLCRTAREIIRLVESCQTAADPPAREC